MRLTTQKPFNSAHTDRHKHTQLSRRKEENNIYICFIENKERCIIIELMPSMYCSGVLRKHKMYSCFDFINSFKTD